MKSFIIRAGDDARRHILSHGLQPDDISIFPAAAGGPKWLVLGQLDRYLFGEWFKERTKPLYAVGSSIGSFRIACGAQENPHKAFDELELAYLSQQYSSKKPIPAEMSEAASNILSSIEGLDTGLGLVKHRFIRPEVIVTQCSSWLNGRLNSSSRPGLLAATLANAVARKNLKPFYQRLVFSTAPNSSNGYEFDDAVTTQYLPLTAANAKDVLLASASIPLAMTPVLGIPEAPSGVFIDGGIVDYHMNLKTNTAQGFAFMPHFGPEQIPGWLDKFSSRHTGLQRIDSSLIMLYPSPQFLSTLPHAKVPDRTDLKRYGYNYNDLYKGWKTAADLSKRIADDFAEAIAKQCIGEYLASPE